MSWWQVGCLSDLMWEGFVGRRLGLWWLRTREPLLLDVMVKEIARILNSDI